MVQSKSTCEGKTPPWPPFHQKTHPLEKGLLLRIQALPSSPEKKEVEKLLFPTLSHLTKGRGGGSVHPTSQPTHFSLLPHFYTFLPRWTISRNGSAPPDLSAPRALLSKSFIGSIGSTTIPGAQLLATKVSLLFPLLKNWLQDPIAFFLCPPSQSSDVPNASMA